MSDPLSVHSPVVDTRRAPSLAWACARLTLVVAVAYPIVALIGSQLAKVPVWETAALAAGICWFSATLALVLFHFFHQAGNPLAGTLVGMMVRMGIPLAAGLIVTSNGGQLRDEGFIGLILVFYLVTLAAETMLSLAMSRRQSAPPGREGSRHG